MLRTSGYRVTSAESGAEALRLANRSERSVDLLITDVVMPGMNGAEVARELRELRPNLPVLYISGYAEDLLVQRGIPAKGIELLTKPFTMASLVSRVRRILDRPAA